MNYMVTVKTRGEFAMEIPVEQSAGYRYDVPFNALGIPYLPLRKLLQAEGCTLPEVRMGVALPEEYFGLQQAAAELLTDIPQCGPFIRAYFTEERFLRDKGYHVRYLKKGLTFFATISFDEKDKKQVREALADVSRIGVREDGISGEVEILLGRDILSPVVETQRSDLCRYAVLDYSFMTITPVCFQAQYEERAKTYQYGPGELLRDELKRRVKNGTDIDWDRIICSNAYIGDQNTRFLPMPLCGSVVKLDRKQFRYRLASDKNQGRVEQKVDLKGAFTEGVSEHLVRYTVPLTEHYLSDSGKRFDVLSTGQVFHGSIYGPDAALRAIADYFDNHTLPYIGSLTEEGCGMVYRRVERLHEAPMQTELYARCFDLCCVSNTILLNEECIPTCRAEDLLTEIERRLVISGERRLKLVNSFVSVYIDRSRNPKWEFERGDTRCFAAGSVLRIETADSEPMDISSLRHCFLGERTADGYGEIVAWPAQDEYDRLAEKFVPERYSLHCQRNSRRLSWGAHLTNRVISSMVASKVRGLAAADRPEYAKGYTAEELAPWSILQMLRKRYDPLLTEKEMFHWYQDALKEGGDETDSV